MPFNPHTRSTALFRMLNLAMHTYYEKVQAFNTSPGYRECKIFRIVCPILLVLNLILMQFGWFDAFSIIFISLSFIVIEPLLIVWTIHVDQESNEMGKIYKEADEAINGDTYAVADANQERLVFLTHELHRYIGKLEAFTSATNMIKDSARFYLIMEISVALTAIMQIISNVITK